VSVLFIRMHIPLVACHLLLLVLVCEMKLTDIHVFIPRWRGDRIHEFMSGLIHVSVNAVSDSVSMHPHS